MAVSTSGVRVRAFQGKNEATAGTVVPVVKASPLADPAYAADVLTFEDLAVLTYD